MRKLFYIILFLYMLYIPHHLHFIKMIPLKYSYIERIESHHIDEEYIRVSLDYFNYISRDKGVFYKGKRPITIQEVSRDSSLYKIFNSRDILGMAKPKFSSCEIYLNPDISEFTDDVIMSVIIHEYLHCLGYGHVDNRGDLMYKSLIKVSPSSILGYGDTLYWRYIFDRVREHQINFYINKIKNLWKNTKS